MTIGLYRFTAAPKSLLPKDLLSLRSRLGGIIGQIRCGMETLDALKVADNVYVTSKNPSASLKAIVNLAREDIHTADHPADIQLLADRLRQTFADKPGNAPKPAGR